MATYDVTTPLIIDPVLEYATFLGGSDREDGSAIAADSFGNAYVAGETFSINYPVTPGAFQTGYIKGSFPGDAFVTKLSADGRSVIYSTYLGGNGEDSAYAIAVNDDGSAYVTGVSCSSNFPRMNPFASRRGTCNAFVTKLNPMGSGLVYSSYIGGGGPDLARGIAVDSRSNAYIVGWTASKDFPTVNPIQPVSGGGMDGFIAKVGSPDYRLVYSTYFGGSANDRAWAVAVDFEGNVFVAGETDSANLFTTPRAFQRTYGGGMCGSPAVRCTDAFVVKLSATTQAPIYSTYLGGGAGEAVFGIAIDGTGSAHMAGSTGSMNFPMRRPVQAFPGGCPFFCSIDAFVAKLNPEGSDLLFSTFLGGSANELATGIAVDGGGNECVTGVTESGNFPTRSPFQSAYGGGTCRVGASTHRCFDAFLTKINPVMSALIYSTYLGGSSEDASFGVALDPLNNAYVFGATSSSNFPNANAVQPVFGGGSFDGFVAKFSER